MSDEKIYDYLKGLNYGEILDVLKSLSMNDKRKMKNLLSRRVISLWRDVTHERHCKMCNWFLEEEKEKCFSVTAERRRCEKNESVMPGSTFLERYSKVIKEIE